MGYANESHKKRQDTALQEDLLVSPVMLMLLYSEKNTAFSSIPKRTHELQEYFYQSSICIVVNDHLKRPKIKIILESH